jgi:tetratricopeptide (TPR) repeat protein
MVTARFAACALGLAAALGPLRAAAPAPGPGTLVLSPGSPGGGRLYPTWPLVLEATLWLEPAQGPAGPAAQPLKLTAKQGRWRDALTVTVRDAQGATVRWPLHLAAQDGGELALGVDEAVGAAWWLTGEETAALAAGDYVVTVGFDPRQVDGLPAEPTALRSEEFRLQVAPEPAPLSAELRQEKLYQLGRLALLQGDLAPIGGLVDQLLGLDPQSIAARRLKAAALLHEGQADAALLQLDEALALYLKRFPKACPPGGLLAERAAAAQALPPP